MTFVTMFILLFLSYLTNVLSVTASTEFSTTVNLVNHSGPGAKVYNLPLFQNTSNKIIHDLCKNKKEIEKISLII